MTAGGGRDRFAAGRPPTEKKHPSEAQARLRARAAGHRVAMRRRNLLLASGTLSALVLLAAWISWGLTGYLSGSIRRIDAGTASASPGDPMNILVAGIDTRDGLTPHEAHLLHVGYEPGSANSDTMMLVHVSPGRSAVTVVSIPRDSWVNIPGHGMSKINAAYGIGGPKLMVRTVEQATGLTVNDYVAVGFTGFVRMINALGGVNVCLPESLDDPYSGLDLPAGRHHLSGLVALEYVRDRHSFPLSDLTRISDQQYLLASALRQAIRSGLLGNPIRLALFVHAVLSSVTVDSRMNVPGLADELRNIAPDNVRFVTVPISDIGYRTPDGESAVLWNSAGAGRLFSQLATDSGIAAPAHAGRGAHQGQREAKVPVRSPSRGACP